MNEAQAPTTTLASLAQEESDLFQSAEARLGGAFAMARESTLLLSTFISSVSEDRQIFVRCMAVLKTHHTLALLSSVRRHHTQAMMNLRQVIESASSAAYALAHPSVNYLDPVTGLILKPKIASTRAYKWIESHYPSHSAELKSIKHHLNENETHFNLLHSARIVSDSPLDNVWVAGFFDSEDVFQVQIDLWFITLAALCTMHLLNEVRNAHGGIVLAADFEHRVNVVSSDCERLKADLAEAPRYQAAMAAAKLADEKRRRGTR